MMKPAQMKIPLKTVCGTSARITANVMVLDIVKMDGVRAPVIEIIPAIPTQMMETVSCMTLPMMTNMMTIT